MGVQVLSYDLVKGLHFEQKISKVLEIVKKGDVVLLEGRLSPDEELTLTSKALESVSGKFSGIEIAYLKSSNSKTFFGSFKETLIKLLAKDRFGITVIGPSKIIKEIKMDPQRLEILFNK